MPRALSDQVIEQIKANLAIGLSDRQIAEKLGISRQSVIKYRNDMDDLDHLRQYNKEQFIADAWNNIQVTMGLLPEKAIDATYKDLMVGMGILVDKLQLLTGEATSRSENANRNVHEVKELTAEQAEAIVKSFIERG